MKGPIPAALLLCVAIAFGQQGDSKRIGAIDFFGYKGLDVAAIRAALPVRAGNPFPGERSQAEWVRLITEDITKVIQRGPTDISAVCCDKDGNWLLYIGLPGRSFQPIALNPAPSGKSKLPPHLVRAHEAVAQARYRAVMKGNSKEDRSQGFSLMDDPETRSRQLAFRKEVLRNEKVVLTVLATSSDNEQRATAAEALGYARRSDRQIAALVKASLDPNDAVRNNSVRALMVLVDADPRIAGKIPPEPFVALLKSGSWKDHNKASLLLEALTKSRNARLLEQLRLSSLDSLEEMAHWRNPGHSYAARAVLDRIAAIEKKRGISPATAQE